MNVATMNVDPIAAQKMLREYRAHRGVYDKLDMEIERIYRQIARGNAVISVTSAIREAGLDDQKRPKLAICRADSDRVTCNRRSNAVDFYVGWHERSKVSVPWPSMENLRIIEAVVPRIPPRLRPKSKVSNYWILWEADWTEIPRDPYLLRRIGKDAWVVLAAWDLTDIEVSVMRAHQVTR